MPGVLIAYFSRSGVTERLARQLADRLGADLDHVQPRAPYSGAGGFFRGVWHSMLRRAPPVESARDPGVYSMVVFGSPVWAGRLSAPMRSYLKRRHGRFGAAAAFWVSGSGMAYQAVALEIERLAGCSLRATASFGEREVGAGHADAKIDALAAAVRQASHLPA
jgi:hypothetical protein